MADPSITLRPERPGGAVPPQGVLLGSTGEQPPRQLGTTAEGQPQGHPTGPTELKEGERDSMAKRVEERSMEVDRPRELHTGDTDSLKEQPTDSRPQQVGDDV